MINPFYSVLIMSLYVLLSLLYSVLIPLCCFRCLFHYIWCCLCYIGCSFIIQCTRCWFYYIQFKLCLVFISLLRVLTPLYSVLSSLYSVQRPLYSVLPCSVITSLYSVLSSLYSVPRSTMNTNGGTEN